MELFISDDLPLDNDYPDSCLYWIYHEDKHTDPRTSGYVGVSIRGADVRFKSHMKAVNKGSNLLVHNAIRKYGSKIRVKVLIKACPEFCLLAEEAFRPTSNMPGTWNLGAGGRATRLGAKMSEEQLERQRQRFAGEGNPFFGKTHTEESRDKISKANFGRVRSDELKKKFSEVRKGKSLNLTEAERKARSERGRAIQTRPDMVDVYAKARSRPASDETKEKISKANLGKKHPEMAARKKKLMTESPWANPNANKTHWAQAEMFFTRLRDGKIQAEILRELGLPARSCVLYTIVKKLKSGWIPSEDAAYLSWLEQYKQKETENVTQTIPSS